MSDDYNGVIPLDKPAQITAAELVRRVKRLSGAKKIGHTGTLDPFATGLMLCCMGQATRLSRFFLHGDKQYQATMVLGLETDTQDKTGVCVAESAYDHVTEEAIRAVMSRFIGKLQQHPPVYSALKLNGIPLYRLARQGRPVQKDARPIEIFQLRVLSISLPEIKFQTACSAGAYIRTLAADIGRELGCGAHLKELRRIAASGFSIEEAISLSELEQILNSEDFSQHVIRPAEALRQLPACVVSDDTAAKIRHGRPLTTADIRPDHDALLTEHIKLVNRRDELLAVIRPRRPGEPYEYCCVFSAA